MLPHFFRHYDPFVSRYFIFDNGSADDSLDILEAHGRVMVHHFDVGGDSFVRVQQRLSDTVWRKSRGFADWVIVVDIDEFIFHPDLTAYLGRCRSAGVTAFRATGYEMVAERFPTGPELLVELITTGTRSAGHDKLCLFDPDALTDTRYAPGREGDAPKGRVQWPERPEMLLLHYKQLGLDYVLERSAELRRGLKEGDIEHGWGVQYLWSPEEIEQRWATLRAASGPVPGLGVLSDLPLGYEERVIAESGLFDDVWYRNAYPDVAEAGVDPLEHYCVYGWKEGRQPNPSFEPTAYLADHPEVAATGQNPFVHYLRSRRAVRALSASAAGEPPLSNPPEARSSATEILPAPSYGEIVSILGLDPLSATEPLLIEPAALLEVLRLCLRGVVVDEERYCRAYPDVAQAVADGSLASTRAHYIEHGYFEGRQPIPEEPG